MYIGRVLFLTTYFSYRRERVLDSDVECGFYTINGFRVLKRKTIFSTCNLYLKLNAT